MSVSSDITLANQKVKNAFLHNQFRSNYCPALAYLYPIIYRTQSGPDGRDLRQVCFFLASGGRSLRRRDILLFLLSLTELSLSAGKAIVKIVVLTATDFFTHGTVIGLLTHLI